MGATLIAVENDAELTLCARELSGGATVVF